MESQSTYLVCPDDRGTIENFLHSLIWKNDESNCHVESMLKTCFSMYYLSVLNFVNQCISTYPCIVKVENSEKVETMLPVQKFNVFLRLSLSFLHSCTCTDFLILLQPAIFHPYRVLINCKHYIISRNNWYENCTII